MTFGITGSYAATPGIEVLAHGIENGISEVAPAAKRRQPRRWHAGTKNGQASSTSISRPS